VTKHRILIEDEQDIAGLIRHALERNGEAEAEIVDSGDAALKAVVDHPPDLVILDLNLPILSGVEVCRIPRSRSDVKHVPIIGRLRGKIGAAGHQIETVVGLGYRFVN